MKSTFAVDVRVCSEQDDALFTRVQDSTKSLYLNKNIKDSVVRMEPSLDGKRKGKRLSVMEKENLSVNSETDVSEHLPSNPSVKKPKLSELNLTSHFSLGQSFSYYSAKVANTRPIKKRKPRTNSTIRRHLSFTTTDFDIQTKPKTLLLPCRSPSLEIELANTPMSFKARSELLMKYISMERRWSVETPLQTSFRHLLPFTPIRWFSQRKKELQAYIRKERELKWKFKRLVSIWLYKKYATKLFNTEDPVTLMEPEKPILLFIPNQRGTYIFELSSITKAINTSLVSHEYLFPRSSMPRNPLTNIPFTEAQLVELIRCIRCYGKSSWAIEGFREHNFIIPKFKLKFHNTIQHNALKEYLKSNSDEAYEHFTDFIEWAYDLLDLEVPIAVALLKWTARNYPKDKIIQRWKTLYRDYYSINITYPALSMMDAKYDRVKMEMELLINNRLEIQRLANLRLQNIMSDTDSE